MIHDRVCETNVFRRYTSLLCVAATPSFRDILSLLIFYKVCQTPRGFLRETNSFFAPARNEHAFLFTSFSSASSDIKLRIAVMDAQAC